MERKDSATGKTVFHITNPSDASPGSDRKQPYSEPAGTSSTEDVAKEPSTSCATKCGNCLSGCAFCCYHTSPDGDMLFCWQTPYSWAFILFCYSIMYVIVGLFMWGMLVWHQKYGVKAEWTMLIIFLAALVLLGLGLLAGERERRHQVKLEEMKERAERKYMMMEAKAHAMG
eukprot:g22945.t1